MAGSFKDALSKSGLVAPEAPAPKPVPKSKVEWKEALPEPGSDEERKPYIPFDAPALTKTKDSKKP